MNKYTFSTQSGKAYYCNSIPGFIKDKSTSIIGQLVRHSFEINKEQSDAWENQICELQRRLEECGTEGDIIFEYDIVRLGKRIDIILLIRHMVFHLSSRMGRMLLQLKMHNKQKIMQLILKTSIRNRRICMFALF